MIPKEHKEKLRNRHVTLFAMVCFGSCLLMLSQFSVSFHQVLSVDRRGLAEDRALLPPKPVSKQGKDVAAKLVGNSNIYASRDIQYIPTEKLDDVDVFAAAWWQTKSRFLEFDASEIVSVEDDAFLPVLDAGEGINDARMTLDWLEFSIEHLSKWWRATWSDLGVAYAVGKLQAHVQHALSKRNSNVMESTLAVIPYGVDTKDPVERRVWFAALAATMASLVRNGVGRILVVGYYRADEKLTREAFDLLSRYHDATNSTQETHIVFQNKSFSAKLGSTELAFVQTNDVHVKGVDFDHNVPRGALLGLQQAFEDQRPDAQDWLGSRPERFKYIYMTESDQILHARLSSRMLQTLDQGGIMVPHRLQPVPHPLDLKRLVDEDNMLPLDESTFSHVEELGHEDSCCDSLTLDKPGSQDYPDCGSFWWLCGFMDGNHSRLSSYQLMRLSSGTSIVSLAATEHGRKCMPTKKGGCSAAAKPLSIT